MNLGDDYPFTSVHQTIGDALTAAGVPFWDSLPDLRREDETRLWVHPTDRHPNEVAHALFAEVVEGAISPLL